MTTVLVPTCDKNGKGQHQKKNTTMEWLYGRRPKGKRAARGWYEKDMDTKRLKTLNAKLGNAEENQDLT